jgi:hypothetical protein
VEIHPSARRHGVDDLDIQHAVEHSLAIEDIGEDPDRWLVIGPDRAGNLLELVVLVDQRGEIVIRTLTDSEIEALADEAEAGYDIDHLVARRNKRGRPTLGAGPASVESVRLDPELKDQLLLRAEQDHTSPSDVIREALRRYLQPS